MLETAVDFFQIVARHARERGERIAIIGDRATVTYAEVQRGIDRFGHLLLEAGIRPEERVIMAFPDGPDSWFAFFGVLKIGAIAVLIHADLTREQYEYILTDTAATGLLTVSASAAAQAQAPTLRARLLLDSPAWAARLAAAEAPLSALTRDLEATAFLLYTSGSTGRPKGVPHSHGDMLFAARTYPRQVLGMTDRDVTFAIARLPFLLGFMTSMVFPLYYGATAVICSHRPTPGDALRLIARHGVTLFFAVPTFYNMLLKTAADPGLLTSLRLCVSSGESLPESLFRAWQRLTGLELVEGLGSTEALNAYLSHRPGTQQIGTVGRLLAGYEGRLMGEDGAPAIPGQPGVLHLRGPSVARSYWNLPEHSALTMLPGGWFNTRDYFTEHAGCYTYLGRADELFKAGGAWVSPVVVENALRNHPAVLEAAVTPRYLEGLLKPVAHVVLNTGYDGDLALTRDLRAQVRRELPDHMCPARIEYVAALPKTPTGKIHRQALKVQT